MIRIKVAQKGTEVTQLTIVGHGNSEKGQDLVCAGVSCVVTGGLNALDQLAPESCDSKQSPGFTAITVIKSSPVVNTIIDTLLIQLATIAEAHSEQVVIIKEEKL